MDANQDTPLPTQIDPVDSGKTVKRARKPAAAAKTDQGEVSQDAALLNSAVQAALETPAMREDKIAAARKALADGTLGQDAGMLADALIDRMLDDMK